MAHRVLGIDIGSTEIKAVLVESTWRDTNVLGVYCGPTPTAAQCAGRTPPAPPPPPVVADSAAGKGNGDGPPAEAAPPPVPDAPPPPWVFGLQDLLQKHKLEYNEIYCALPASKTTTRIMTLPFDNRRRLEQILPFELENVVPFDLEEMHLSFEVLGKDPAGGFRVLVTLTPKKELAQHLRNLALVGVDPRVVDVSSYALYAAAKQFLPDGQGVYAMLDLGATHADVAVLNAGELIELRSIPIGADRFDTALADSLRIDCARAEQLKREKADIAADDAVGRTLRAGLAPLLVRLRQTLQGIRADRNLEVTHLYLTGRGALLTGLDRVLADELGVEVAWGRPLSDGLQVSADANDPAEQARFAGALALVHRGVGALRKVALNLRHGAFVYQRQQMAMQASVRTIAIVGGIVLALILYNVIASQVQKRRQVAALQNQMVQLYLKAFPGSVPPPRPLDQFRQQIDKTMAKQKSTGFFGDANLRAIDIVQDMSKIVPPNMVVDIKKLDLAPDILKIEGEVPTFPDGDNLEKTLKLVPGFKEVKKELTQGATDKIRFRFDIKLVDVKKQVKGASGRPGGPPGAGGAPGAMGGGGAAPAPATGAAGGGAPKPAGAPAAGAPAGAP
jgi:type IV pilus assembly protein PilM